MTIPTPTLIDDAGFSIWKLKTEYDVQGAGQAMIVELPSGWTHGAHEKFFVQVCGNSTTGAFKWSARVWFNNYSDARGYVTDQFKAIATSILFE
jgi:hypothetical protein